MQESYLIVEHFDVLCASSGAKAEIMQLILHETSEFTPSNFVF